MSLWWWSSLTTVPYHEQLATLIHICMDQGFYFETHASEQERVPSYR
jgi:hypothetical protein